MKITPALLVCATSALLAVDPETPANAGIRKPGVQRPVTTIVPEAVFPLNGTPDWIAIAEESVWVANKPKNAVARLSPRTNLVEAIVPVGKEPCSGLATGFGSLWVPNCGDQTLSRVDLKANRVVATIPSGVGDGEGGIAVSPDSVWILTDKNGTLARIDPGTNLIVAEIAVVPGSYVVAYGEGSVWVTSTEKHVVSRVDPKTNRVTAEIPVGEQPRFLAAGEGSVWTLNQKQGTVSRIDPKTNRVVAVIETGVSGTGGDIAVGGGSVWVTGLTIPLTRIDAKKNEVVQQWTGKGGDSLRFGHGSVWLTNQLEQNVWRLSPLQP